LSVGTHSITGVYSGDAGNQTSTSSPALSQVITGSGPPPASVTLTSTLNPAIHGQPVRFTATVTGAGPTGTVAFKDGAGTIAGCATAALHSLNATSSSATCVTFTLTVGTHSIVAAYGGDAANGAASSPPLSEVIQ
jgi:hypothetical protein